MPIFAFKRNKRRKDEEQCGGADNKNTTGKSASEAEERRRKKNWTGNGGETQKVAAKGKKELDCWSNEMGLGVGRSIGSLPTDILIHQRLAYFHEQ